MDALVSKAAPCCGTFGTFFEESLQVLGVKFAKSKIIKESLTQTEEIP